MVAASKVLKLPIEEQRRKEEKKDRDRKKLIRVKRKKIKNSDNPTQEVRVKKIGNAVKGWTKEDLEKYKGKKGHRRKARDEEA